MQIGRALLLGVVCAVGYALFRLLAGSVAVEAPSPDESMSVYVWERWNGPDVSVRITIQHKHVFTPRIAGHSDPTDRLPRATEVYWKPDLTGVAVLICDSYAADKVWMYSIKEGREVDNDADLSRGLLRNLQKRYATSLGIWPELSSYCRQSEITAGFERQLQGTNTLRPPE